MPKPKKETAKQGRPTLCVPDVYEPILHRLASGESLNSICKDESMPHKVTVIRWRLNDGAEYEDFRTKYAIARQIGYELLEDELFDIADDGRNDWMLSNDPENEAYKLNGEHVQRSRLRVDTRKWYLSKVLPKLKDGQQDEKPKDQSITINLVDAKKPDAN